MPRQVFGHGLLPCTDILGTERRMLDFSVLWHFSYSTVTRFPMSKSLSCTTSDAKSRVSGTVKSGRFAAWQRAMER